MRKLADTLSEHRLTRGDKVCVGKPLKDELDKDGTYGREIYRRPSRFTDRTSRHL